MITPIINAVGTYSVKAPFETIDGVTYKCVEILKISALEKNQVDVFATYYEPNGLSPAKYVADKDLDANIVHLAEQGGGVDIILPSTYILALPSVRTIPYSRILLSIDLGLIPDSLSLASTITAIKDLATDVVGVDPTVKTHRVPVLGGIDANRHELLELNRNNAIAHRPTAHADVARLSAILDRKLAYIAQLEEALVATSEEP